MTIASNLPARSVAHSPTGIYPLPDFCDGLCGHDRGGKARPDLAQSKEEAPQKRQDHSLTQAPSPSAPTVAKIDFFSDEPLKRKRGGKARPDLAPAVDGAGGAGGLSPAAILGNEGGSGIVIIRTNQPIGTAESFSRGGYYLP